MEDDEPRHIYNRRPKHNKVCSVKFRRNADWVY